MLHTRLHSHLVVYAALTALTIVLPGAAYAVPVQVPVFEIGGPTTPGGAGELIYDPDVSNIDLLQGLVGVESGAWGAPASRLNDGVHGGSFDQGAGTSGISWPTIGASVTFTLGLGDGFGYDITEIQSIAAWQSAGFGNQGYTFEVQPVGGAFELLTTVDYTPLTSGDPGATKVNITDDGTGPNGILATGIEAIRFTQTDLGAASVGGRATYRELDVFGMASGPPAALTLQVNRGTGALTILGDDSGDVANVNSYEILSAGDSLSVSGWESLEFQDNGPDFPAGDGSGNGWEEAGSVSSGALAELFAFGSSTFVSSSTVPLGDGYDTSVDAQDLTFNYTTTSGTAPFVGTVVYIDPGFIPGDFNGDGTVDAADYTLYADNVGQTDESAFAPGTGDGMNGVDPGDYALWRTNFGNTAGGSLNAGGNGAIPEPTSVVLLTAMLGIAIFGTRKNRILPR